MAPKRRRVELSPPPTPPPPPKRPTTRSTRSSQKPRAGPARRARRPTTAATARVPTPAPFLPLPTPPVHHRPALELVGWGSGQDGQLGTEAQYEAKKPKKNRWMTQKMEEGAFGHEPEAGLESITAAGMHSLFIDEKGVVWSFGVDEEGGLGRLTDKVVKDKKQSADADKPILDPPTLPAPIRSLEEEGFRAVKISACETASIAISDKGELRLWGSFRASEGRKLGFSKSVSKQFLPTSLLELKDEKFVAAAGGDNHLILLTQRGHIYTLGVGEDGQMGRRILARHTVDGTSPGRIILGTRSRLAVVIGAGRNTGFAVDSQGTTWGWGINSRGQTGTGMNNVEIDKSVHTPKPVIGLSPSDLDGATVVQIAGGMFHTIFLTSDGRVYACGDTTEGRLGIPADDERLQNLRFGDRLPEPTLVSFPEPDDRVVEISCGANCNFAITEAGALYSWGRQVTSELGLGHDDDVETPTAVIPKDHPTFSVVHVSGGGQHVLALVRKKA